MGNKYLSNEWAGSALLSTGKRQIHITGVLSGSRNLRKLNNEHKDTHTHHTGDKETALHLSDTGSETNWFNSRLSTRLSRETRLIKNQLPG